MIILCLPVLFNKNPSQNLSDSIKTVKQDAKEALEKLKAQNQLDAEMTNLAREISQAEKTADSNLNQLLKSDILPKIKDELHKG